MVQKRRKLYKTLASIESELRDIFVLLVVFIRIYVNFIYANLTKIQIRIWKVKCRKKCNHFTLPFFHVILLGKGKSMFLDLIFYTKQVNMSYNIN